MRPKRPTPTAHLELHADREPPLQLREHVRRLGRVEGARADEEHVVGGDVAVLGGHDAPLDDRQQVALDALGGGVGAVAQLGRGHDLAVVVGGWWVI